jgi:hypothetical protein
MARRKEVMDVICSQGFDHAHTGRQVSAGASWQKGGVMAGRN